ncbi:MAG: hypothetical protein M3R04_06370, partial [bacterium]|nr:hypothetical protein [bacterium]
LFVAILWSLCTLMWLPWFAVLVRFIVDLISGTPWSNSEYLGSALIAVWPERGWLSWEVVSYSPLLGVLAMLLTYLGWRIFWWERDWRPSYPATTVAAGVLIPPLSLLLLYLDARRRFRERNVSLQQAVDEALESN